jgi:pyruvate kinase
VDFFSRTVWQTVARIAPVAVLIPTLTGHTARMVSRFKLPVWIAAVSPDKATCAGLQFSYGVSPVYAAEPPADWTGFARHWAQSEELNDGRIVMIQGPSKNNPETNPRLEILNPAPPENKTSEKNPRQRSRNESLVLPG